MSDTFDTKVVRHVAAASAAMQKAAAQLQAHAAGREKAAELVPLTVDALIASRLLRATEKEAATAALADHTKALQVLMNVAGRFGEQPAPAMGSPAPEKVASHGASRSGEREADRRFRQAIGLG